MSVSLFSAVLLRTVVVVVRLRSKEQRWTLRSMEQMGWWRGRRCNAMWCAGLLSTAQVISCLAGVGGASGFLFVNCSLVKVISCLAGVGGASGFSHLEWAWSKPGSDSFSLHYLVVIYTPCCCWTHFNLVFKLCHSGLRNTQFSFVLPPLNYIPE